MSQRARRALVSLLFVSLFAFRIAVVATWHAPGGDGVQYWKLAQELKQGRFAFGPPPTPVTYTRLPGYPLLTAVLLGPSQLSLPTHIQRAVVINLFADAVTAGLLYLTIVWVGRSRRVAIVGAVIFLLSPLNLLVGCYALTETIATTLLNATVLLALVLADLKRPVRGAFGLGLIAGFAQLTRSDSMLILPFVAWMVWRHPQRARVGAACLAGFLLLFSPWLVRNTVQFGRPYPLSTMLRTNDGEYIPEGFVRWARTWSASQPGDSYLDLLFTLKRPIDPKQQLRPDMFDSEDEKRQLLALFARYNKELFTEGVSAEFERLATERTRRNPLRTFVTLPCLRMIKLLKPLPEYEMPMRVSWLGLPAGRPAFAVFDYPLYLAALTGVVLLARRRQLTKERDLLIGHGSLVGLRLLLFSFLIPVAAYQRYLVEAFPSLIVLAVVGLSGAGRPRERS